MSPQSFLSCSFISHVCLRKNCFITKKFKVQIISSAQVKLLCERTSSWWRCFLLFPSFFSGDEMYEGGIYISVDKARSFHCYVPALGKSWQRLREKGWKWVDRIFHENEKFKSERNEKFYGTVNFNECFLSYKFHVKRKHEKFFFRANAIKKFRE